MRHQKGFHNENKPTPALITLMGLGFWAFYTLFSLMAAIDVAITWYQGGPPELFVWTSCILFCVGQFLEGVRKSLRSMVELVEGSRP
jgi:hypothetical protein